MNITRLSASMHTTSKTSEGNPTCSDMTQNSAKTGKAVPSLLATKKVAKDYKRAPIVMGGRNNSSILSSTRLNHARNPSVSKALSAPSIIAPRTEESLI